MENVFINEQSLRILNAKQFLDLSDYKIIKCMEAYLCGEELPYDIKELHAERNNYRNIINSMADSIKIETSGFIKPTIVTLANAINKTDV